MWKANVKDIDGEILSVSQFTLLANTDNKKPDFRRAMVRRLCFTSTTYSDLLTRMSLFKVIRPRAGAVHQVPEYVA